MKGYTVKKVYRFSHPQPGCHLPNSHWAGIIKLFPVRESMVSDIPAGDKKIANVFYSVAVFEEGRTELTMECTASENTSQEPERYFEFFRTYPPFLNRQGERRAIPTWQDWFQIREQRLRRC